MYRFERPSIDACHGVSGIASSRRGKHNLRCFARGIRASSRQGQSKRFAKFFSRDTLFNTTWVNASSVVDGRDGLGPLIKQAILLVMPYQGRQRGATKFRRSIGRLSNSCQFDGTGFQRSPKPHPIYGNQISVRALPKAEPESRLTIEYRHINGTDLASLGFAKEHPQLKNMDR